MAKLNINRRFTLELDQEELLMLQECVARAYTDEKSGVAQGLREEEYANKLYKLFGDLNAVVD